MPSKRQRLKGRGTGIAADNKMEEHIINTFGLEAIKAARERLCRNCPRNSPYCLESERFDGCFTMLPLTTRGEDCPYFDAKVA